jgi:HAD superfamily 5'-nucleotidase-like hydrolase
MTLKRFSLSKCDWIGFDLDHTIVRYKLGPMHALIFHSFTKCLVEVRGYPDPLKNCIYDENFAAKGVVFDMQEGNFLKINAAKKVVRAYHGRTKLDKTAIRTIYKNQPLENFEGHPIHRYKPLLTFFDIPAIYLLALMVEIVDSDHVFPNGKKKKYSNLWDDLIWAFQWNFDDFYRGMYFEALRNDTYKYIYKRPDVRNWLLSMKKEGIGLFLVTNSKIDYAKLLLKYSFGEDWRDLFDIVISDGRKPAFFSGRPPFKKVDLEAEKELEDSINIDDFDPSLVYAEGNWFDLQDVFMKIDESRNKARPDAEDYPLCIYFGDRIIPFI